MHKQNNLYSDLTPFKTVLAHNLSERPNYKISRRKQEETLHDLGDEVSETTPKAWYMKKKKNYKLNYIRIKISALWKR